MAGAKRGQKSAAELATPTPVSGRIAIRPPEGTPADVRKLFAQIVATTPDGHFRLTDVDLLVVHCQAVLLTRKLYPLALQGDDDKICGRWERTCKLVTTTCTRLRLSPQTRDNGIDTAKRRPKAGMDMKTFLSLVGDDAA